MNVTEKLYAALELALRTDEDQPLFEDDEELRFEFPDGSSFTTSMEVVDDAEEWAETATEMEYYEQEEVGGVSVTDEDVDFGELVSAAEEVGNLCHFKYELQLEDTTVEFSYVQCGDGDVIGFLVYIDGDMSDDQILSWAEGLTESETIAELVE